MNERSGTVLASNDYMVIKTVSSMMLITEPISGTAQ
jgi:hypothetical protein